MKLSSLQNSTLGIILAVLVGCQALADQDSGLASAPRPDGSATTPEVTVVPNPPAAAAGSMVLVDEVGLRERVKARWDAVIQRDFHAAYEFASPAYRRLYSAQQHAGTYGQQLMWKQVSIRGVDGVGEDAAKVTVRVIFLAAVGHDLNHMAETSLVTVESWVRDSGQWWYVPER